MNQQQINLRDIPKGTIQLIVLGIILVIALYVSISSSYTIAPEEEGLVLRFGKYVRTEKPGLHFKWPSPIEVVKKVPVQRQLKEEFGFRSSGKLDNRTTYSRNSYGNESLMLTGDLNVATVTWITQYRVVDAYKYLFKVRDVEGTIRDINEAVMRSVIGDHSVNEVLTVGRERIAALAKEDLSKLCESYELGILIENVALQDVNPPQKVKASFNKVNGAQQERESMINSARALFNRDVPRAAGEAQQSIQEAKGYAKDRVNRAEGDVKLFTALLESYNKAPEVMEARLYLEAMKEIFPKIKNKVIVDKDMKQILPLLKLDNVREAK